MIDPVLSQLLPPPVPDGDAVDIARLRATRPYWITDSLARLLVYSRLSQDFTYLHQPDSAIRYLRRAWQLAPLAPRRGLPAERVVLARDLAYYHYAQGAYDSTRHYFQLTSRLFHAAGLDSLGDAGPARLLPTNHLWASGWVLAGTLASAGSASRALGELPAALAYYERASALYQGQQALSGLLWVQSLLGETYAEQDNYTQAAAAYEQALRTARRYLRQQPTKSSHAFASFVLDYYAPLLLTHPKEGARASRLAAEAMHALQAAYAPQQLRDNYTNALVMARLELVPAQAALQTGQRRAALTWLTQARRWLRAATRHQPNAPSTFDPRYAQAQALSLGLQAWLQHSADPGGARRQLTEATGLLAAGSPANLLRTEREQLARYCLAMGEPAQAVQLLRPLLPHYQHPLAPQPLSQVTGLLTQAYAGLGRYDSAYCYSQRTQGLVDTLRQSRQFAALTVTEARFRTREQTSRIALLTRLGQQQTRYTWLAGGGAVLLALLALGAGLAWRTTRRLNARLAGQAQQLQAQATRLSELDAAKSQFFANVSHELRTPLTLVLGPLGGLLGPAGPTLPTPVREPVMLAHRHARRLLELVNRILDLTKLEAGRLTIQPVPTDFTAWLRRVVAQFDSLAVERSIMLVAPTNLPAELTLVLDADKVEQILTNLLANALTHTPAGGTVGVRVALPGPDQLIEVTVYDTGPGIAPAEQVRVFERFYQSPQRQAQGGTGLGLALSRELAQLLGGTLTLRSEEGQGASFTLRLPASVLPAQGPVLTPIAVDEPALRPATPPEPAPADLAAPFALAPGPRPRVLVVEDQADLREYLRTLLAPTYEVLLAEDGQAALALLAREAPVDLLTTDAMMPQLSGTELLARLRSDPAYAHIPALMLTARADEAHRLAALTVGVDDYLTKPFVPAELLARVGILLARQQVRRHFAALPPESNPSSPPFGTRPLGAPSERASAEPTPSPVPVFSAVVATEQLAQWQQTVTAFLADPAFGPAELAVALCLSERTLYRRLGELAGLTPAAWLRELRLTHARQLLEAGGFNSVAEVATAAGFGNVKSFSQRYAERFGRRPSEYRRREE